MQKKTPKVAWVTGASKGIGFALLRQLAKDGWLVAATARSTAKLSELKNDNLADFVHNFPCDITSAKDIKLTLNKIEKELGNINLAILNAGTHMPMSAEHFSVSTVRALFEINVMGTANCLEPLLKLFIKRKSGHIAIVSSLAGYRGLPSASAYGATKAALINMCEALKPELDQYGINIQLVNPGFVKTPLTDKNTFPMPFLMKPEDAAETIISGLQKNTFEISFPWKFALPMKILRIIPDRIFFILTKKIMGQ